MRTPLYLLIATLLSIGACTNHYHVTPAGQPAKPDRIHVPEPDPIEPLELDVGRPTGSQLPLQTNRPAYVAIFEIVPNRGVTLIYPAAAHQQNMMVSGMTWVPLWWSPKRLVLNSDRYIYAIASDEPLNLSADVFASGYFHRVLGPGVYRAERPYSTMRAISRSVLPDVAAELWAEDVYVLRPTYQTEVARVARIYCPGGRVFEVPEDMVTRVWCPTRTRVVIVDGRPRSRDYPVTRPARPDSVYGHGGGRVRIEPTKPRGPIARIVDPTGRDRDDRDSDPRRRGRPDRADKDDKGKKKEKARKNDEDSDSDSDESKTDRPDKNDPKAEPPKNEPPKAEPPKAEPPKSEPPKSEPRKKNDKDSDSDSDSDDRQAKDNKESDRRGPSWFRRGRAADEPKTDVEPQGEQRSDKPAEKAEPKRAEPRSDSKRRGSISATIKAEKERKEKEEKEKKAQSEKP